jgi:outer membrane protein, heavy metal efflux system
MAFGESQGHKAIGFLIIAALTAAVAPAARAGDRTAAADGETAHIEAARDSALAAGAPAPPIAASAGWVESLVGEALVRSPAIAAARDRYEAATRVPIQEATLPDPQISLQHFTVGSAQPAAGYETSDFYYTGIGVSQEIPGPGKLGLRKSRAEREADAQRANFDAVRRQVAERARETCFELFFLERTRDLLDRTREELGTIEKIAEQQYRVAMAQQQDLIKAQLQMTAILRELADNREQIDQAQADLKSVLGRDQDGAAIAVGEVAPAVFTLGDERVRALAEQRAPELAAARAEEAKSRDTLALARKDYLPDFSLGYMYQKTGPSYRDYYMLTLGARIPLYFWRKQRPAVEQAALEGEAAKAGLRARRLDVVAAAERDFIAIHTAEHIITLYRDALVPQAEASRAAALAAYRTGKVDFQTLVTAVIEVLDLRQQYVRAIADHEIALARLRQLIGEQP